MSSTGQAFVKSFARRSQTNSTNARATVTQSQSASTSPEARPDLAAKKAATESAELESAEVWVDSFDDTTHQLDRVPATVPAPHFQTGSLQHTHTAYDSTGTNPANRTEIESAPHSPATRSPASHAVDPPSESPEAVLAERVAKVLQPIQAKPKTVPESIDSEADAEFVYQFQASTKSVVDEPANQIGPAVQTESRLSADSHANAQTGQTLRPSWEVEVFDIPQSVADLFFEESLFQDLSDRMKEASQGGLRTMLMTSALTGEGRTTVAIGVALAAASSGLRVALVDGDLAEPTLAEELRLDLDHGWVESIRRGVPIKEIAVHALEDNLTLIPLLPTDSGRQATAVECAQMIESLKPSFDLIIVDGPTADARDIRMLGSAIDSVIIVHDVNQSSDAAADLLAARLQRSGIDGVGIVENFA